MYLEKIDIPENIRTKQKNELPDEKMSIHEQISSEMEILGNIHIAYPEINKRYVYVMSVDKRFAPRAEMYCLATGKRQSIKVYRKTYENKPFFGGRSKNLVDGRL